MVRAQYSRGNIVCALCGKKTAHDGRSMAFMIGTVEASISVTRCSKCAAEFVDDDKVVRSGRGGGPVTPQMWRNRLDAIDKDIREEQRIAACHIGRARELSIARDALVASGLLVADNELGEDGD